MDDFLKLYNPEDLCTQTYTDSAEKKALIKNRKDPLAATFPYNVPGSKERIQELQAKEAGVFFATNPQGEGLIRGVKFTTKFQYLSLDLDVAKEKNHQDIAQIELAKQTLLNKLKNLPIPPYGVIITKNGLQPIWKFSDFKDLKTESSRIECNELYKQMCQAVSNTIGINSEGDNISRVVRFPGYKHLKTPSDPYKIAYQEISGRECTFEGFNKAYPVTKEPSSKFDPTILDGVADGYRTTSAGSYIGYKLENLKRLDEKSIKTAWAEIRDWNEFKNPEPKDQNELKDYFDDTLQKEQAKRSDGSDEDMSERPEIPWPSPLNEAAFHGVLGRLVKLVEPETEADPAAVLIGSLVTFGSIIGRGAYLEVGPVTHYLNLFNATVGHTAKARKGVASAEVRRFFNGIDSNWEKKCKKPSCSTGEGIIHHIRDRVVKLDEGEEKVLDPGIDDKRLFIDGDELAATLQTMSRAGNTLSSILRLAYDGLDLSTLTKNNSEKACNPHVAISANITEIELKRLLTEVDLNNGFANRFLFTAAKRSKELPLGGNVSVSELDKLKIELEEVVAFAKTAGQVTFDNQTQEAWIYIYHELTSEIPGLVGVLSARSEPQTLRIAAIYALADHSNKIQLPHLRAALAVMDYTTETLFYLFGNSTGDPIAEKIIEAITRNSGGMTKTEINNYFGRNLSADQISSSIETLLKLGKILEQTIQTAGRSRVTYTLNSFNSYWSVKKHYLESLDEFITEIGLNTTTQAQNNTEYANEKNERTEKSPGNGSTSLLSLMPNLGCNKCSPLTSKPPKCYECGKEYPKQEREAAEGEHIPEINSLPGLEGYGKT